MTRPAYLSEEAIRAAVEERLEQESVYIQELVPLMQTADAALSDAVEVLQRLGKGPEEATRLLLGMAIYVALREYGLSSAWPKPKPEP